MTADAKTPNSEAATTQSFEADVSRLLHLMVHSVYSDREIFIRELVSNAADACEKLRYEAIANPELIADGAPFAITIALDKDAKTLTVSDNGIGMSREDLTAGLGTIARSGTKAFLDKLAAEDAKSEAQALIGQFGIGFYSAFMVADEVVVETRRAGADEALRWSSDGKGSFTIAPLALDDAPLRGTRVILHLNAKFERISRLLAGRADHPRPFGSGRRAGGLRRQARRRAETSRRRRGDLGQAQVRGDAGGICRILPRAFRAVR